MPVENPFSRRRFLKTTGAAAASAPFLSEASVPSLSERNDGEIVGADDSLPVRGLCIAAPQPGGVDAFATFIREEVAPRHVNTLILRVDYHYEYKSHPELVDSDALSEAEVKKIVAVCRQSGIRLIPHINQLGHQSWASDLGPLLTAYPQFDETPWVKLPDPGAYHWPNPQGYYCKSYCPLHPDVHEVVFDVTDELCDVFEADAFHAGMDEVFYIAEHQCPRCGGRDPAVLYAEEVRRFRNHLADEGRQLWIWGDRLLDGKTTGLGMWEASMNNTYRAIDRIPTDTVICDWHYERALQTAVYFAMKGFQVVSCPFQNPQTALWQKEDMLKFRQRTTPEMKDRYQGLVQTVWSDADAFLKQYYAASAADDNEEDTAVDCFKTVFAATDTP